jgi:amino acid adenylation domain-containing protein/non-ribosomal peptide synthase protein (TIGR01720 family)
MSLAEKVEKAEKEKESAAGRSERIAALTPEQRELLALLRRRKAAEKRPRRPPTAPPIPPRGPGESSPLSFDQERLWFLYYLDPGATAYNIDTSTRMEGRLDVAALVRSLNGVVVRHEAWRTTFQAQDGRPVQVVAPAVPLDVPVVDLRRVPAGRRDAVARAHQRSEARRPFDLAAGPLVRALLLRLTDDTWICMLTVHHIVTDWVTFQLFWRELALLYTGETRLLPALPRQYADFAVWQRDWLTGEVLETYLDFWLRELEGAPQVLDLPFDRPRPPIQTTRGAEAAVEIPGFLADGLKALARQAGATPFMAVLTVFDALLCRLTGQGKVLVGSPNANRNRAELEPLFGFFLTQLVFVADGSGNPTFRELLGRVRGQALGAYAHQDLPFGKLLEAMRPERDNSRPPLVQANFLLLDSEYTPMELPELKVTPIWVDDGNSRFDMTLGLWDSPSRIFGFFEYNLDLFDPTTVARMAAAFSALVEHVVADPEVRLADLPMLSAAARHQVLGEWNDTGTGEREPTVPDLFAARVRERPEALALACGEEISFFDLDRAAEHAARRLQAAGIGRGDVVGLALDRSPALGVGVLALWKAGAVLLPLDPAAPRERLAFLVADAGAKALLTRESLRGRLPETALPVLDLADGNATANPAASATSAAPLPQVGPDDLAYLLYTSGTTGQPKGVAVEHGNLAALLAACRREFRFRPSDRFLAVAPFSFDIFFFELLSPLLAGGCSQLFAPTSPLDMDALLLGLERATLFHAVPALLRQVLAAVPAVRRKTPAAFAALRTLFVGGDAVPADLLASLAENFPQAEVRVLYGPTEATILATTERIAAGSFAPAAPAARVGTALGRPLPGVRLRVVDASGGLAAVGVAGELWIGGAGVARGYVGFDRGLAELTADRFVAVDGERWYRTGDRVRYGATGSLEFLGRVDGQVKIRGFRVEPGEVEAALAADPEVAESVVVARTLSGNSDGDKQLVAYVVPRQGQEPESGRTELWTGRLAERLRERLPGHLVPSLFVALEALPLTPHGKVDRKALPAEFTPGDAGSAAGAAPRNEREAALAAVWQGVLGLGRVGIHDNFFQIGGDSILSIQVVARARKAGLLLTPKQLFEHQTIAGLAAIATATAAAEGMAAADAGPVSGEAPLTPIQRAFFAESRPEPWRFNQALLFVSRAALDPRLLGAALSVLVDHHDALRLRFIREGEGWKQAHAPAGFGAPLVTADLSALPAGRVSPAIESAVAELQGGFDLARGPLFLGALFRCGTGDDDRIRPRLLLAAHHLVVDGVSWRILLEDLETAYSQLAAGERPGLPARTTSFKSWAERLAAHARSPAVRSELGFWAAQEGGSSLPIDFPGGGNLAGSAGSAGSAATVTVELPERQTRELLRQAPAAYRTRVDELLLAALARVLARATGGARVLLDVEGHGREETLAAGTDLSRTVGWFTSLFPLALDLTGAPGPGAAIKAVKEQLRAVPHKGIGYGLLRWPPDPAERSALAAQPTPEVSFNYLGQVDAQLAEAALLAPAAEAIRGTESPGAARSHRIDVSGLVLGERLRLDLTYSTELHRAATIEALAADLRDEIAALVDHCLSPEAGGSTPADFPLARLRQDELDALLGAERGIEDLYPLAPLQQGMLFHTLFQPGSELYFEQLTAVLRGPLDVAAFTRAWQRVIDRHPALRAAFLWEGAEAPLREPLQVIRRDATVEWEVLDWRQDGKPTDIEARQGLVKVVSVGAPPCGCPGGRAATGGRPYALNPEFRDFDETLETRFRALAAADRRRGFDLARPPLLRLTFVRTGPAEHRLLWSFHHLLFDGWCFSLLFSEVFALYAGLVAGTEPILPPVHPYRDYIAWLAERDPAEAEEFWRRSLAGFVAPTPLPYDHAAAGPGLVAADYREPGLDVGPAATAVLVALAQRLGVTLNIVLQGAWALLLSRFARETDVVFGTVVSGRPADLPGVESIVGLFINTVPVRARVPAAGSLAAWLGELRATQAERTQQEWTPLARIQALSEVPAGEPLFASLFLFENYPLDAGIAGTAARLSGLAIDDVAISERTNYALTLTAAARGGDLTLRLLHDRRFEPATARRLLGHLAGLLAGFVADPERSPADVPLLDAAERHQLLVEWAETGRVDLAAGPLAPESFRARAAEDPGALAVVAGEERLTYGELARRAERLARRLRALGLGREAVVGLAVGRSLALAVGVLGILEAGAAWVPLDPALPAERLAFLLADSGARAVVTEERFAARLPTGELPVLFARAAEPGETAEPPGEPLPQVSPRDLAYVLYTSGTTGQPKGVMVEHGQLAWILAASRRALGWGRDERVLALAPFSFDISIWELLEPLTQGGACEIFPLDPAPDLVRLAQSLRVATRMHAVPALMRQVAATIRDEGGDYPRLRALYMAGEAVPAALQAEIASLFPGVDVRVLYGPTEGAVFCSGWRVAGDGRTAPLGRAFPGASFRLVDPAGPAGLAGLPVPIGAPGELWLGGAGVARGYRGRPERTAERFVPGPAGERWYRTGDLARLGPDGNLEFLGRLDDQVKIRGVRIEPGEIEAALSALPEVREAAVLALPHEPGDRRLVAFVVPETPGDGSCDPERLAAGLRAVLPEPLVPAAFVALPALPRTAHGKLDRRALAALAPTPTSVAAGSGAPPGRALPRLPRNAAEAALAAVWRGVLGIEEVGLDDNFFRLGGDSILSLQVVARARRAGIVLTPRQLFEHPTIAALAALVGDAGISGETLPGMASGEQGPVVGEAPLTPVQRWFLETAGRDRHHFAQAVLLDVPGALAPLDALGGGVLAAALGALADHHDALRLRFIRHPDGGWRQAHAPAGEGVPFLTVDLSALPEVRFPAVVTAAATELQTGFDLGRGPLFLGAHLVAGSRARLLLAAHHLVVDTVSWRILLEDLETAWDRLAAGRALLLPAKTTSFKSWGEGLERAVRSPELDADRAYWLDGLDGLAGPGSAARGAAETILPAELAPASGPPESISLALSPAATEALLRRAPAAYRTQVNDLLLTALGLALGADRRAVQIDLEGHGREGELVPGADLSRTVGWFTSIFPLTLDLSDVREGDLGGAIRRVKETLRALPHRGLGHGLLRYLGSGEEQRLLAAAESAQPVEIAFNYLGQLDLSFAETSRFRLAPEPSGSGPAAGGPRRHVLEINAMVLDDRLRVDWAFATGPGARPAAELLGRGFLAALEELIEHCLSPQAGGLTASDFPLARLDELHGADWETLYGLVGSARDVEDLYPLAPLQEGMLFHDLYAPGSGLYLQQLSCTLEGPLDRAAFHRAWQGVVDRHPALRTAFVWQGLPRALQVVRRGIVLPWEELDFRGERGERGTTPGDLEERLERLAAEIRSRGLDPGRAPLLSAVLVRTGEEEARFLWTFHHLLFDGWCFALLFRDVFALYAAEVAGRGAAAGLRPAPPYRDYIAWLARRDAADYAADSERYWRGVLAGFAAATPLPLDRPRDTGAGGGLEILLPAAATLDLTAFARASELTLNSACQGAWALLLSRYGGGDDVVFGTVVAGRPPELPGVEEMVGLFINTLPVRHVLNPAEPVGDLLRRAQAAQVEMRQHEQAPLALVQRWSAVPPGEPLFLSLFVFENFPVDDSLARGAGPLAVRDLRIADRTDYPLAIALSPATVSGRLSLRFAWDGQLEPTTVERLARHYETLLTGLIAGGSARPAGDLPLLSTAERRQLLDEWGMGAAVEEPRPALLLHQLVAAQAARTPDALAILQGERAVSYAELARAAAALALRLCALGVGPEVRVPLLTERSPEAIVGIVAVLAAGGAYVPLDPGAPAGRLGLLLAEIGGIGGIGGIGAPAPGPLLLTARTAALLPEEARAGFLPVFLDGVLAAGPSEGEVTAISAVPAGAPVEVLPENLAYVLYTSGSTGNPKGVMVTHGAIAAYVRAMVAEYGVGPGDRELQASALSFDPSVEEIFTPLTAGGAVVLPEGAFEEPARFLDFCRRTGLTLLSLPTAYWHTFVATLAAEDLPAPPEARLAIIGGERALPERWAEWGRLAAGSWGRVRLVNGYGPTEATVVATLETHPGPSAGAADGTARAAGEVAIGRPLPGAVVRVVGRDGSRQWSAANLASATDEPLPAGAAGELLLGGPGLARGYLDHPALTAERFVPDPGGAERGEPGARLYRTGDRVRFLADGRLQFLGRVDSQVKVRGFRIELGEVEGALAAHPAVLDAAAGTREDASGSRSLVAWVVARDAGPTAEALDAATLARFLAARLPAPMVPTEIAFLPALPRNASDKIDRRALALLAPASRAGAGGSGGAGYLAPRNAMEEEMAALWRDLLGVDRVGVEDDFFALGGHSLLATQLVSRLRRQLGVELPLARLFELRTLAAVSREVLDEKLAAEGEGIDDLLADLDGLSDEEALALLAAQEAPEEEEDDREERR